MITFLAFLLTISLVILVHEWGHYRVAVACGVKVLKFSLGFGRVLLRWRRGETEFAISMLPLGGFVRMLDEREGPVAAHELHRAFNRKSLPQRAAIVAAGPMANLVLAVLLYAVVHWIGSAEVKPVIAEPKVGSVAAAAGLQSGDWIQAVRQSSGEWADVASMSDLRWQMTEAAVASEGVELRVTDRRGYHLRTLSLDVPRGVQPAEVDAQVLQKLGLSAPFSEAILGDVIPDGPAALAGLRKGDKVLRIDEAPVLDAAWLRFRIREAGEQGRSPRPMQWDVDREGVRLTLSVLPKRVEDRGAAIARVEAAIGGPVEMVDVRYGFLEGLIRALTKTWDVSMLSLSMMGKMLIGQASLQNLSGPLTIADYAGQSAKLGLPYYIGFVALVSVSLGVLNLLPVPMLDGGHLMYYLFEGVTGRPVSPLWLERFQRGGLAIMLAMMSLALYNDVARLLGLH